MIAPVTEPGIVISSTSHISIHIIILGSWWISTYLSEDVALNRQEREGKGEIRPEIDDATHSKYSTERVKAPRDARVRVYIT